MKYKYKLMDINNILKNSFLILINLKLSKLHELLTGGVNLLQVDLCVEFGIVRCQQTLTQN